MRILFTSFAYYPEISGVPIVVKYLAEGLVQKGHDVAVATRRVSNCLDEETINGVKLYRFNIKSSKLKPFGGDGDIDNYISFVINYKKDVLVLECLQCYTTDVLLPYLSKMNCRKFIHSHGSPGQNEMRLFCVKSTFRETIANSFNYLYWKRYYYHILPKYSRDVNGCICLSVYDKSLLYLSKLFKNIKILENAADDVFFEEQNECSRSVLGIRNKKYIVCVANFISSKNQLRVIEEYTKIKTRNISLVLVGAKPTVYYKRVLLRASGLMCENKELDIQCLYGIDRSQIPSIIAHAELFVFCSETEQYPVVLAEAMASGTPFVCNDVGNARILPGGVTYTNETPLSVLVDMLLTNENLYAEYKEIGRKYTADCNRIIIIVNQFETIIS